VALIANNYCPSDLCSFGMNRCTLAEFLKECAQRRSIIDVLLEDKEVVKRIRNIENYRTVSTNTKIPTLLSHLWQRFSEQEKQNFWTIIQEFSKQLVNGYRDAKKTQSRKIGNKTQDEILNDPVGENLFKNVISWRIFVDVVYTFLELVAWKEKVSD
jgi:hypothetical protein